MNTFYKFIKKYNEMTVVIVGQKLIIRTADEIIVHAREKYCSDCVAARCAHKKAVFPAPILGYKIKLLDGGEYKVSIEMPQVFEINLDKFHRWFRADIVEEREEPPKHILLWKFIDTGRLEPDVEFAQYLAANGFKFLGYAIMNHFIETKDYESLRKLGALPIFEFNF